MGDKLKMQEKKKLLDHLKKQNQKLVKENAALQEENQQLEDTINVCCRDINNHLSRGCALSPEYQNLQQGGVVNPEILKGYERTHDVLATPQTVAPSSDRTPDTGGRNSPSTAVGLFGGDGLSRN